MQENCTAPPADRMGAKEARERLIAEYGDICLRCKLEPGVDDPPLAVDHIIPVAKGGQNRLSNYQLLCGPCNSWKGLRVIDFRPDSDGITIQDMLEVIPNELRARKASMAQKPASPPPSVHDCREAFDPLLKAYVLATDREAVQAHKIGTLQSRVDAAEPERRRLEERVRIAERNLASMESDRNHQKAMRAIFEDSKDADRSELRFMRFCTLIGAVATLYFFFH